MPSNTPLPIPETGSSGNSSIDRRRFINTSEESGISITQPTTFYRYRAGVPALHHLPLITAITSPDDQFADDLNQFRPAIDRILTRRGIILSRDMMIAHRYLSGDRPSDDNIFFLIVAKWDTSSELSWLNCAMEIKELLVQSGIINVGVEILGYQLFNRKYMTVVEEVHPIVQAWSSLETRLTDFLFRNHADLAKSLCAINVLRLGYSERHSINPVTILVILDWSVNPSNWAAAEQEVKNRLHEYQLLATNPGLRDSDIRVLFENGENVLLNGEPVVTPLVESEKIDDPKIIHAESPFDIRPGASIGAKLLMVDDDGRPCLGGMGTIGPILKLSSSSLQSPRILAVTNYHAIRYNIPGFTLPYKAIRQNPDSVKKSEIGMAKKDSILYKMDRLERGFGPKALIDLMLEEDNKLFRSPAMKVVEMTLEKTIKDIIEDTEELTTNCKRGVKKEILANLQLEINAQIRDRDVLDGFLHTGKTPNKSVFGKLYAGSSPMYRTRHGSRVDYALIEITDLTRKFSNIIPDRSKFCSEFARLFRYMPDRLSGIGSLHSIAGLNSKKNALFKYGAATKASVGSYSHIQARVFLKRDGDVEVKKGDVSGTLEFCVLGGMPNDFPMAREPTDFADHGDSGAAVWNQMGEWVGLVFGGHTVSQTGQLRQTSIITYVISADNIVSHIQELGKAGNMDFKVELYEGN